MLWKVPRLLLVLVSGQDLIPEVELLDVGEDGVAGVQCIGTTTELSGDRVNFLLLEPRKPQHIIAWSQHLSTTMKTRAANEPLAKFLQARRRPQLQPSPG